MFKSAMYILLAFLLFVALAFAAKAPHFRLPGQIGGEQITVDLDSLRGKVVYLDFWASWCDPCRKSFPWMEELKRKFGEKGFIIVAINLDKQRNAIDKFLSKYPVSFTVAFDPEGKVAKEYDIKGMPTAFLVDRKGEIVSSHIGFLEKETAKWEHEIAEAVK